VKRRDEFTPEEATAATHLFAMLLRGFERVIPAPAHPTQAVTALTELLHGFISLRQKPVVMRGNLDRDALLTGYAGAVEHDRVRQETLADEFNLLDVVQVTHRETRHSMVLAWLLDADFRKHGTHAQGRLGLRIFLHHVRIPVALADHPYGFDVRLRATRPGSMLKSEVVGGF
jgi:PD-(D/E)XK nuclease superfamily protein